MPVRCYGLGCLNPVEAVNGQLVVLQSKSIVDLLKGVWDKKKWRCLPSVNLPY